MATDKDNEYHPQDESEYHFSDDDMHYDNANDEVTPMASMADMPSKKNALDKAKEYKRMLISAAIFLVLVFIVYKMVSPSKTVTSTNITAPTAVSQTTTTTTTTQTPATVTHTGVPVVAAAPTSTSTVTHSNTAPTTNMGVLPSGAGLSNVPNQAQSAQPIPAQENMAPISSSQTLQVNPGMAPTTMVETPTSANIDAKLTALQQETKQLATQMSDDYTKKIDAVSTQSKAVQDELQTLNGRVANIEAQLNQLFQALVTQNQNQLRRESTAVREETPVSKVSYNVQAIIPGRAWLKSDSGDTLTVAEGDVIKNLGRVSKIDPYDGIVQVNTGTKTVSLSYGNGG